MRIPEGRIKPLRGRGMYSSAQLAFKYVKYWLTASNGKGHGIHSPFVFDFINNVLNDKREFDSFRFIENVRAGLRDNDTEINVPDFGAGSRMQLHNKRKISAIARSSLKPKKFSQLLFRIVHYYKPKNILELGTSLGITTSYLSAANPSAQIITMEGAPEVAATAKNNFKQLHLSNIRVIEGNFDDNLLSVISQLSSVDLAFIDGNHRKAPTLDYFCQLLAAAGRSAIFIFDDIHWSREMEAAWGEIKAHPSVTLTVDLFFIGLVFFRTEQKIKQDFVIRF
ncbi:O-methyltransferase [Parafilimonas sp.]|uniref:O-methyltransferase n=1 Tax=Parafilimonas sp. TaxID=1969739 RepID=UPI0039E6B510